jgi:hypothetical protein
MEPGHGGDPSHRCRHAATRRLRGGALAVSALASCAVVLGACGSSGPSQASSALSRACQDVSAVLSDGPDPTADPVGYAEAQILPLRHVRTSDAALEAAIEDLDSAYQQYFSTNGASTAKRAVTKASTRLDAICPGATS